MFRLVLRLTLPLIVACALLAALAPHVDQRAVIAPPEWTIYGFDTCALPCWAGITLGQTSFARTLATLRTNVGAFTDFAVSPSQMLIWGRQAPDVFDGFIYYAQERVNAIRLNITLPPDQLIARLGLPDCVYALDDPNPAARVQIVYWVRDGRSMGAWMRGASTDLFTPAGAVYALWIEMNDSVCEQTGATRWKGVAPWWRYADWANELD